jgi:hypothetical protein
MDQVVIRDDFFSNPDEIRNIALNAVYYEPLPSQGWKGYRTHELLREEYSFLYESIENEINSYYPLYEGKVPYEVECYFHYTTKDSELNLHKDWGYFAAGIVYLHSNPPEHSGTKVLEEEVENVYNRIVYYDANSKHGIVSAFGDCVTNARLTLTFFVPYPPYWKLQEINNS